MSSSAPLSSSDIAAGTGARNVTGITQLYFRICDYDPLVILVVDSLCVVFGADGSGATVDQLVEYLGLSEAKIVAGIDGIPSEMRCTSRDLARANERVEDSREEGSSNRRGAEDQKGDDGIEELHYLNYRLLLPIAFAHVNRLLLTLCMSPVPVSALGVQDYATSSSESISMEYRVSLDFRQQLEKNSLLPRTLNDTTKKAIEANKGSGTSSFTGIACVQCKTFHHLGEFDPVAHEGASSLSESPASSRAYGLCPTCGSNVLQDTLQSVFECYQKSICEGNALLIAPPLGISNCLTFPAWRSLLPSHLSECPLALDPLLVQQAMVFLSLFKQPFACLNDELYIVDAADMLTQAEFNRRRQVGSAVSAAEKFRSIHRNAQAVHVKFVSSNEIHHSKIEDNWQKLVKRALLPPWMCPPQALMSNERDYRRSTECLKRELKKRRTRESNKTYECTEHDSVNQETCRSLVVASRIAAVYATDEFEPIELPFHKRAR